MRSSDISRLTTAWMTSFVWFSLAVWETQAAVGAQNASRDREPKIANVEELYILRSVRESRVKPTDFCEKAGTRLPNSIL